MLKKYGPAYGRKPDVKPTNAIANAILGACYIKDIIKTLEKKKIPVNAGSIDAGLHVGEGGVVKLYKGDSTYIYFILLIISYISSKFPSKLSSFVRSISLM